MGSPDSDAHVARDAGEHPLLLPSEGAVAVRSGRKFDRTRMVVSAAISSWL